MASAHLAELTASSRLKISTIKVGGSPLYYLPGQEAQLQKYTSNMNDKEKKAFDLLSQNKVLRDSEQEPVIRVALREIKDFAIQLNVNYDGNKEVFWKWYLANDQEAEQLIKSKLQILEKPIEKKAEEKIEATEQKIEEKTAQQPQKQIKEKKEQNASELVNGERVETSSPRMSLRTRSQLSDFWRPENLRFSRTLFLEQQELGLLCLCL